MIQRRALVHERSTRCTEHLAKEPTFDALYTRSPSFTPKSEPQASCKKRVNLNQ